MAKGASYEREICRMISGWWLPGRDDIFWRTSNSGGRMTVRHRKGKSARFHAGDIAAIDPIGQPFLDVFAIEVKRGYSKHTVADLFDKPEGAAKQIWEQWHEQILASQQRSGAHSWLLITKRDRREALVFMPASTGAILMAEKSPPCFMFVYGGEGIQCMHLERFFELVDPEDVRSLHKSIEAGRRAS